MAPTTPRLRGKKNLYKPISDVAKQPVTEEDREPGVVYIGHIPHGFYEKQLRQYFSQFGQVMQVKLSRSKKTGKSKGYAFVKFRYAAVAKTVAETCNNYLFFNKLLKCEYKRLSEVHDDAFHTYRWKKNHKPKRQHNSDKTEDKLKKSLQQSVKRHSDKLKRLEEMGIKLALEDLLTLPTVTSDVPAEKDDDPHETETVPSAATPKAKQGKRKAATPKAGDTTPPAKSSGRKAKRPQSQSPQTLSASSAKKRRLSASVHKESDDTSPVRTGKAKRIKK